MNTLTRESVRKKLNYCFDTGHFTWKSTGKRAGGYTFGGYRLIQVNNVKIREHRLAMIWMDDHCFQEGEQVDHINGIRDDNRYENLRIATNQQNNFNRKTQKNNKLGFRGVCKQKGCNKFRAHIKIEQKKKHLGYYDTFEEAKAARLAAEVELFGEYRYHGG